MKEIIFYNGRFIAPSQVRVAVCEPGFLYGWGLFETMRAYHGRIVCLKEHLKRLKDSCRLIEMEFPYSQEKCAGFIRKAVSLSGFRDAQVRLTVAKRIKGVDVLIWVKAYRPYPVSQYRKGFRGCIFRFRQNQGSFLSRLKTTNYLFYRLADSEARKKRCDEALILNNLGYLTEGSRSNIFFVRDQALLTPALECGCLDGVTRRLILDLAKKAGIPAQEGKFTLADLYAAEESFLTNSLMGVMPLKAVDNHLINRGLAGRMTKFFMRQYQRLMRDGT